MRDGHYHQVLADLGPSTRELRRAAPAPWVGFGELHAGAMADGDLSTKAKELIALAIAVNERCDGCIAAHARAVAKAGATDGEVADALGVALLMGGGPASIYAPRAWDAYREFCEATPVAAAEPHATDDVAGVGEGALR